MADITQLLNTGSSANRVDIAIVAEGYTLAERDKFLQDAQAFLNSFLGDANARLNAPFSTYKGFFNASALFYASAQSGTDQPNSGISVNTYFSASQHGSDGRLLYGDSNLVETEVSRALPANAHELTIVLVNTPLYGGAGGAIAWASAGNISASELALHEIGHSFAGLQDEYVDSTVVKDFPLTAAAFLNSSHVTDSLSRIPWSDWLGYHDGELGTIGTYQGGYYRASGVWRATEISKMLYLGYPFSAPEKEAFALKYYQSIGDYLSAAAVLPGIFSAVTPNNDLFSYTWKYAGQTQAQTKSDGAMFDAYGSGNYLAGSSLSVTTIDHTGTIRKNIQLTQQTESISMATEPTQVKDTLHILGAKDSNAILQFAASDDVIELKNLADSSHVYIDGGAGNDVLKIDTKLFDSPHFSLYQLSTGTILLGMDSNATSSPDWALHQVESLQFQDFSVNLHIHKDAQQINATDLANLEELYVAYFNRVPEADGLDYWITQFQAGASLQSIGNAFFTAAIAYPELTGYTDKMSDQDFVNVIYKNALGRSQGADPEGLDYWTAQLANGTESKGSMIHTILGTAHSYKGDPTWGWVADLLDNKIVVANKFAVEWGLNYASSEASITSGMHLASLVTPTDVTAALHLIGISDGQIQFV